MSHLPTILTLVALLCFSCSQEPTSTIQPTTLATAERGPYALRIYTTAPEMRLDQPVEIAAEVAAPEASAFSGVDITPERLPDFEVSQQDRSEQLLADGRKSYTLKYLLDPWIADKYTLPAITAKFQDGDKEYAVTTEPVELKVNTAVTTTDIDDALPLAESFTPAQDRRLMIIRGVATAAATLLALWLCFVFVRRYWRRAHQVIPPTPYQQALAELATLEQKNLLTAGDFDGYYTGISTILRKYLEARFDLRAPKLTTEEFLSLLGKNPELLGEFRLLLKDFLTACDQVKFAAQIPGSEEASKLTTTFVGFLEATKEENNVQI